MKQKSSNSEAKKIICDLLKLIPTGSCDMFHHSKKDRHEIGEECPVVARYKERVQRAVDFVWEK